MKMTLPFIEGPLHGIKFEMDWLPELHMAVDESERTVHAYKRNEMAYWYDKKLTAELSAHFDEVLKMNARKHNINPVV